MVKWYVKIIPEKTSYSYHEVVNFSCIDGYTLIGESKKKCQQTGDFQRNLPDCTGNVKTSMLKYVTSE